MTQTTAPTDLSLRTLLAPGIDGVRRYWRPFVMLQAIALLVVVGYYQSDAVRDVCHRLAEMKTAGGLLFSAAAVMIAGALLPEAAKAAVLGERRFPPKRLRNIAFAMAGFAGSGIITDLQYRLFDLAIGPGTDAATVTTKVLTDQFFTTPLYGVPYWIVLYSWRANRFNLPATLRQISPRWYAARVLPLLLPCWCFWIPMTAMIFSLPGGLQFCLFSLAIAAWSLVMIFIASRPSTEATEAAV